MHVAGINFSIFTARFSMHCTGKAKQSAIFATAFSPLNPPTLPGMHCTQFLICCQHTSHPTHAQKHFICAHLIYTTVRLCHTDRTCLSVVVSSSEKNYVGRRNPHNLLNVYSQPLLFQKPRLSRQKQSVIAYTTAPKSYATGRPARKSCCIVSFRMAYKRPRAKTQ